MRPDRYDSGDHGVEMGFQYLKGVMNKSFHRLSIDASVDPSYISRCASGQRRPTRVLAVHIANMATSDVYEQARFLWHLKYLHATMPPVLTESMYALLQLPKEVQDASVDLINKIKGLSL